MYKAQDSCLASRPMHAIHMSSRIAWGDGTRLSPQLLSPRYPKHTLAGEAAAISAKGVVHVLDVTRGVTRIDGKPAQYNTLETSAL